MNRKKLYSLVGVIIVTSALSTLYTSANYLLDNLSIVTRKNRGADESRRVYVPKSIASDTVEYKPSKQTEYQKKFQIAENYIIKAFPKEFHINKVVEQSAQWSWLKRPLSYKYSKQKIVVHHTAESNSGLDSIEKERKVVEEIYKFHTFGRWRGDIGYNYLIWPSGTIFEWRYWGADVVAAHAVWNNTDSIWISLLGNFDKELPTKEQVQALIKLLTALGHTYKINPLQKVTYHGFNEKGKLPYVYNFQWDSIVWHTDVGSTSCPGKNLYDLLPTIKRSVAKELGHVQVKKRMIRTK